MVVLVLHHPYLEQLQLMLAVEVQEKEVVLLLVVVA
jgi:hypothetical protein